jgi:hypothetical protein
MDDQGREVPEPLTAADLHKAVNYIRFYRTVSGYGDGFIVQRRRNYGPGIEERVAWTQAGWFEDFKYAKPYTLNSLVKPSKQKIDKPLHVHAGKIGDKKWIIRADVPVP